MSVPEGQVRDEVEGQVEMRVLEIFRRNLRNDAARAEDDFFSLGGDSFLAMEVIAELSRDLSYELELAALVESTSLRQVMDRVARDLRA